MLHDRDYMRDQRNRWAGGFRPDAVTMIIVANAVIWVLQHVFVIAASRGYRGDIDPWGGVSIEALSQGRVWTLVTHMFVHGGLAHVLFNCIMIFFAGRSVQSLLGARPFLYIYFISGVAGAVLQLIVGWLCKEPSSVPVIGASGAACGVVVALAVMLPQEVITALIYFIIPVRVRLWTFARVLMGASLVLGLMDAFNLSFLNFLRMGSEGAKVAHFAHLGGALAGWYLVRWLGYGGPVVTYDRLWTERRRREQSPEMARANRRRRVVDLDEPDNLLVPPASTREFIEREIDPILDKIAAHGLSSLTETERGILERGRQQIIKRRE